MEATQMTKEKISAWLDGELPDAAVEVMLAALATDEGRACWNEYHQIGDSLRSDELAMQPSAGFAAKMAARLAQEPVYLLPLPARDKPDLRHHLRQKMWPGLAIAAGLMVVLALPYSPLGEQDHAPSGLAQRGMPAGGNISLAAGGADNGGALPVARTRPVQDSEMLRDPQIQQYLQAHQRYLPQVYNAQYAQPVEQAKTGTDK